MPPFAFVRRMGWFSKKPSIAKDPVCGMDVDPKSAFGSAKHDDDTFYFCSKTCLDTFRKDEHRYAHG